MLARLRVIRAISSRPLSQGLPEYVEHGDQENSYASGSEHSDKDGRAHTPPRDFRAPLAHTSGTSPRMKAIDVIITARNRNSAPSVAASWMLSPRSCCSLANSIIKIPFFAASAIAPPVRSGHKDRASARQSRCPRSRRKRHNYRQQNRNRDHPALVQGHQKQEGKQHRKPEDDAGLPGCSLPGMPCRSTRKRTPAARSLPTPRPLRLRPCPRRHSGRDRH